MIEKFSKEELNAIMKELKMLPKNSMKRYLCEDSLKKLLSVIREQKEYNGIYTWYITDNILSIADYALCNYEINSTAKKSALLRGETPYKRAVMVKPKIQSDYAKLVDELVDVIVRYVRKEISE